MNKKLNKTKYSLLVLLVAGSLCSCGNTEERHHTIYVEGTPATCTEDGVMTHYHCDICNKDFKYANGVGELTNLVIPAKGHQMHEHSAVESTCTESGHLTYYTCDNETGVYYKDINATEKYNSYSDILLPLADHDFSLDVSGNFKTTYNAFETFSLDGLTLNAKCKNCDYKKKVKNNEISIVYEDNTDSFRYGQNKVSLKVPSLNLEKEITGLTINKIQIDKPSASETNFEYDGTEKTLSIIENDKYEISNNKNTNVGQYETTISLVDKNNYEWSDGTSNDFTITYTIGKPSDLISGLKSSYETICCNAPDLSGVSCSSGNLVIKYYKDQNCTQEVLVEELIAGNYFIKATTNDDGFNVDTKTATLLVKHDVKHYGKIGSTIFKEGHIEYWGCSACGKTYKDQYLKHETSSISLDQHSTLISESAICSNDVSYAPQQLAAPQGFEKVNKVNLNGNRLDTKYYSQVLVNSFDYLTFAIRSNDTLLLDGYDKYISDGSWIVVEVSEISEFNYSVIYKDESGSIVYENSFTYSDIPDTGYVSGGLNTVMFKACTYIESTNDLFVTELRGYRKENEILGEIVDESAISGNGIAKEKLSGDLAANGFENVYKIGVNEDAINMHGQYYSDKVLTNYSEVHFALKTSGYWSFGGGAYAYKQNEWVYFDLTNNNDNTFNLTVKDKNNSVLYSKNNMSSFKGDNPGVYTNYALNTILFGNADICPCKDGDNALLVYASEIRGTLKNDIEIVKNSVTEYSIVYQDKNRHINRAVELLTTNLREASSLSSITSLKSSNEQFSENSKFISIGNTSLLRSSKALDGEEIDDGYLIKTVGNSIFVYTKVSGDYITAVNKVMELMFGYKYLSPTETVIERNVNINFPKINTIINPSFKVRNRIVDMEMLDGDQSASLGYTSGYEWETTGYPHPMSDRYLNYDENKDSHPNWYSIGEDRWGQTQRQLCYSAHGSTSEYNAMVDGVCNNIISDVNNEFAWTFNNSNEPTFTIDLSMQDNWYECNCSSCQLEKQKYGSYAGQQLHFVNDIANKMDVWFAANKPAIKHSYKLLAYQQAEVAPSYIDFTLNKNLLIQYAPVYVDITKPIAPSGVNKQYYDELKEWVDLLEADQNTSVNNLCVWNYSYSTHNIVPAYDFGVLNQTYECIRKLGIKNISTEFVTNGSQLTYFQDLRLYLMARSMEDTTLDVNKVSKDFIDVYYGAGSEKIYEFLQTANNNMKSTYTDVNTVFETHNNKKYWSKTVVQSLISLCDEALEAINSSEIDSSRKQVLLDRVNRERLTPVYMLIQFGYTTYSNKNTYKQFFNDYCSKFGVTHVDTSTSVSSWLSSH